MHDIFKGFDIILASQSPRRQQLLADLELEFRVETKAGIEEVYPDRLKGDEIAIYLAELKANVFQPELNNNSILITADTLVLLGDEVLGKPQTETEAVNMLQRLSGKAHRVVSGVCISSKQQRMAFASQTKVFFKPLAPEQIVHYVEKYKPMDKAGSYGIQEWIGYVGVERIEGSYFNVMGLPVQQLYDKLVQFAANEQKK